MFNFFRKKAKCPVSEEMRIWLENALIWLIRQFGEKKLLNVKQYIPAQEDFPLALDGTEEMCARLLNIVATQMDTAPDNIQLNFYNSNIVELDERTGLATRFDDNEVHSVGFYELEKQDGKFSIAIERSQLKETDKLIATLAHELSHIKILGEGRLQENNEYLTDLATVFFGFGVFSANSSFKFYSNYSGWGYSRQGYLSQQEWAYSLALFAYIREEKLPGWTKYLSPNIRADYIASEKFIYENQDKVLV
jgi:hypothetical protein